jgi:anti-sigma factor RsiW
MRDHDEKRIRILERALIDGYRSRSDVTADVDVTQAVMREIRRSQADRSRWSPATVLDQLVWRTAAITAAVVLTATVLTVGLLRGPAGENPMLLVEEFDSVPLFGD